MTVDEQVEFRLMQVRASLGRVPQRFRHVRPEDVRPDLVGWVAAAVADLQSAPSVWLSGPTGVGKTHQAVAALSAVAYGRARAGLPCRWESTTHPSLNASQREFRTAAGVLERYQATDLLLLDDFGTERNADLDRDVAQRLIDHRWAQSLPTIFTTNLTPDLLAQSVGDRVMSRLGDTLQISMLGDDRRWAA
jgi:DNA replication protein DnaC